MLAYLLIICAAFYIVSATLTRLVGEYLFNQKVSDDLHAARQLAVRAEQPLRDRDGGLLYQILVEALADDADCRALVLDPYGVVQTDTQSQLNGACLRRREVAQVLAGQESGYGYYLSENERVRFIDRLIVTGLTGSMTSLYAVPIGSAASPVGVLVYVTMSENAYSALLAVQRQMLSWLLLVAAIVVLISLFLIRFFTKPISELNEGIEKMTRGDFSNRVRVHGKNEFAQLATAFNMMCDRIENLDKSRSQFVSNASHELKTPLSTMKILIETLMYQNPMDPAMTREFLGDINKEIDRLNSVIGDLLTLVSMDGGENKMEVRSLQVSDLLGDNMKRLQPLARERGIEMTLSVREQVAVDGDANRLTQVFYNLMDNAIKYTGRGGSVRVELLRRDKKAVVRVSDTGIGIPKADQPHIFDRFYRVDKARSRETGGTGLGLSIVRQIIMLHGGAISVASEENKGSTFTVELPESGSRD